MLSFSRRLNSSGNGAPGSGRLMEREKKDDGTIARAAVSEKMQQPMTEQRNPRVSSRRDDYALFLL